jgi:hypothetical protein
MTEKWRIQGGFLLNCNCDDWCPCVLSMGKADPTHGRCLSWGCIHREQGYVGDVSLDGLTTGLLLETPVMAKNAHYWVGPDVNVAKGTKSRFRDWGRNWDLSGQSSEFARIDWQGP